MPTPALSTSLDVITDAQRDMRHAYAGGSTGLIASATAWLVAGVIALTGTPQQAVVALFVGGMCIHPVGVFLAKLLGRSGNHSKGNPLGGLALESTALMILALPLAYVVARYRVEWFFPAMLLIIGGRYLTFATLYGTRIYWACGATLAAAAYLLVATQASPHLAAFTGAGIEAVFGVVVLAAARRDERSAGRVTT